MTVLRDKCSHAQNHTISSVSLFLADGGLLSLAWYQISQEFYGSSMWKAQKALLLFRRIPHLPEAKKGIESSGQLSNDPLKKREKRRSLESQVCKWRRLVVLGAHSGCKADSRGRSKAQIKQKVLLTQCTLSVSWLESFESCHLSSLHCILFRYSWSDSLQKSPSSENLQTDINKL